MVFWFCSSENCIFWYLFNKNFYEVIFQTCSNIWSLQIWVQHYQFLDLENSPNFWLCEIFSLKKMTWNWSTRCSKEKCRLSTCWPFLIRLHFLLNSVTSFPTHICVAMYDVCTQLPKLSWPPCTSGFGWHFWKSCAPPLIITS
jgi:hypothetical protein